ncbi:MAG: LysR family transcriptional regulator [Proteobacteria bacterium]|nr:LysR family transcriptional regulator [Pseudomonadota bacterium]HQR03579.1 LysR family transcriptional regulator [Rhodocyclaceae bacterium]
MKFTLRQLQVFAAVARLGSVSRAAQAVALSQSATSTALAEFERMFDCRLFDRVGKALRINALGEQLLPKAVELLDRAAEVEDLLEGRAGLGPLRIGATLTIGNYLATLIAADFLQRHADARLQLTVHNTAGIVEQVAGFELDLGLIEGPCRHPDLVTEPWIADDLAVFCAPGHPLAKRHRVPLADLRTEPWILRERGSGTRERFDQAMAQQGMEPIVKLELEHTEAIKRAVESGLGLGCISRLALREAFRRGSLILLPTPELDLSRRFQFLWHKDKYQTAAMREFLSACRTLTRGVARSDDIPLPYIP